MDDDRVPPAVAHRPTVPREIQHLPLAERRQLAVDVPRGSPPRPKGPRVRLKVVRDQELLRQQNSQQHQEPVEHGHAEVENQETGAKLRGGLHQMRPVPERRLRTRPRRRGQAARRRPLYRLQHSEPIELTKPGIPYSLAVAQRVSHGDYTANARGTVVCDPLRIWLTLGDWRD